MSLSKRLLLMLLPALLPWVVAWVRHHERKILKFGSPLNAQGLEDAVRMGVAFPEKVRVLEVERIPVLNGRLVRMLSRVMPILSSNSIGLSLGYGIYVRSRGRDNRRLIAHECVHTGQYERYGGPAKFLRAYIFECLQFGYPAASLEQEAVWRVLEIRD